MDADIVVVGCGIAGLSAAAAAHEAGARVVVLERAPKEERGGNTRYTEAYLRMNSIDEVSDDFEEKLALFGGGHLDPSLVNETSGGRDGWPSILKSMSFADPDVIATFAENAGPALRWLRDKGVRFDFLPTAFITTTTPRLLPIGGGLAMVEAVCAYLEAQGVPILYDTAARDLIMRDDGGVGGIRATGARNKPVIINARAVVLACGGFEGNQEMQARYLGPRALFLRPVCRGGNYNKGEGIRMALDIGAAPCGDFGGWHAEPIDPRSGISEPSIFIFPYGILVNREGKRFINEAPASVDACYEEITRQIHYQSEGMAYCILDSKITDVPGYHRAIKTDQPAITANTIAELAGKLGMPVAVLEQTIASYNAACGAGSFKALEVDGLATHGVVPEKSNWARPIDTAPFQAYPIISANVFTYGGLKVNPDAQVVNADGEVIPGLYAAGETMGLFYKTYTGSTSVLRGAVFGRIAGQHAARTMNQ